jgi:hypothetical protein
MGKEFFSRVTIIWPSDSFDMLAPLADKFLLPNMHFVQRIYV